MRQSGSTGSYTSSQMFLIIWLDKQRRQHPELFIWLPAARGRLCPPGRPFPLRAPTPGTTTRRGSRPRGWCAPTEQMHAGSLEGSVTIRKARGYSLYNVLVSSGSSQWNLPTFSWKRDMNLPRVRTFTFHFQLWKTMGFNNKDKSFELKLLHV